MFFDFNRVQLIHRGVQQEWCKQPKHGNQEVADAANLGAFRGVFLARHLMTIAILNCENRESVHASRGVQDARQSTDLSNLKGESHFSRMIS